MLPNKLICLIKRRLLLERESEVYAVLSIDATASRPRVIRMEWIQNVIDHPVRQVIQADGRIRCWASLDEMEGRYLRVILLGDGETVHNAFFDRSFTS